MSQPPGPHEPGHWGPPDPARLSGGQRPGAPDHWAPPGPPPGQQGPPHPGPQFRPGPYDYRPYAPGQQAHHPGLVPQWAPPPARSRRAPKLLMGLGSLLLAAGVLLGGLLGSGLGSGVPDEDDITPIGYEATVQVEEHLLLYNPVETYVTCDVYGPVEGALSVEYAGPDLTFTHGGVLYTPFGQLGAEGDPMGEYRVACDADGVIAAPPLDVGEVAGGAAGLTAGVLTGGLGLALLLAGLIWHVATRQS